MAVSAGKLYLIVNGAIQRLDATTLQLEASAAIPAHHPDEQELAKEQFMTRFDRNGDGEITMDELDRPEALAKIDENGDGKITRDEVPMPRVRIAQSSPASLLVEAGNVYVFQNGQLFRFRADTLELEAEVVLGRPDTGGAGAPRRADMPRDRVRRKESRNQMPPQPEAPEETPRF
jgi:Ca2+-binding EF-hand superfamily protein